MQCLYWDGERARVEDRPRPELPDPEHWARVRVGLAGVCATDLEITRGYMGFRGILGHEFAGRVEDGPAAWRDERVVGEINFACGNCAMCDAGLGRHCPNRRVMGILDADGVMAESVLIPVANLHRIPDSVPDEAAVFSEPLAAAFEIPEQVPITRDTRAVVFGDGRLGLLCAQVLHASGAETLAVGKHTEKLALLADRGIAVAELAEWDRGRVRERVDLVVEATGSRDGLTRAMAATRPRGTLVLKSTVADAPALDLSPLVIDEIQVVGSRCGPFAPALAALESGTVAVTPLIHDRLPLTQADQALRRAAQPGILKVLVDCL